MMTCFEFSANQVSFSCHIKIGGLDFREEPVYELVQFVGYFREYTTEITVKKRI